MIGSKTRMRNEMSCREVEERDVLGVVVSVC